MARRLRAFGLSASLPALALVLVLTPASVSASGPRLLGIDLLAPVGRADAYATPYQTALVVAPPGVLANDTDPEGSPLTAQFVSGPGHGTLTLSANGGFRYQPTAGYSGADMFTYRPSDGFFHLTPADTVAVTMTVAVPTPTPMPTPTPKPTPKPTPMPTPTPTLTLPPIPLPTVSFPPLPTLPVATPTPIPVVPTPTLPAISPVPTPGLPGVPGLSPGPASSSRPSDGLAASPDPSAVPGAGGAATGGNGTPPGGSNVASDLPILAPQSGPVSIGSFGDFGLGIEWLVPTVLVTVPGFLVVVIGLAQIFGGFVWLPLARRWLRGDGRQPTSTGRRLVI